MTHQYTKLADDLEGYAIFLTASRGYNTDPIREAARILRAAAAVDVAGLMALHDEAAEARHVNGSPLYNVVANESRAALESALRLALAAREGAK